MTLASTNSEASQAREFIDIFKVAQQRSGTNLASATRFGENLLPQTWPFCDVLNDNFYVCLRTEGIYWSSPVGDQVTTKCARRRQCLIRCERPELLPT